MEPITLWDGQPVIGFMADSYLDDLQTGWFQALQSHVDTSNYRSLPELGTIRHGPFHLVDTTERSKDALVSQSPIVVFKSRNMLQALGIVYGRIVLPSSDVKGETKGKTYCPTTWNYAY